MPANDRPPTGQNSHGGKRQGAGRPPGAKGRGATFKQLREAARNPSEDALNTIANIMDQTENKRLAFACAKLILEWAWGKPR